MRQRSFYLQRTLQRHRRPLPLRCRLLLSLAARRLRSAAAAAAAAAATTGQVGGDADALQRLGRLRCRMLCSLHGRHALVPPRRVLRSLGGHFLRLTKLRGPRQNLRLMPALLLVKQLLHARHLFGLCRMPRKEEPTTRARRVKSQYRPVTRLARESKSSVWWGLFKRTKAPKAIRVLLPT